MKKIMIASLVALSALSVSQMASAVHIDQDTIRFECPNINGVPSEKLTNFGTYISGRGEQNFGGKKWLPLFRAPVGPLANIPADLTTGGYSHNGTSYNPSSGRVSCHFKSSLGYDAFAVSYVITNGKKGAVLKSSNSKITIRLPMGLK